MDILLILIPISLICSSLGLLVFILAVNSGQFDRLDSQKICKEIGGRE